MVHAVDNDRGGFFRTYVYNGLVQPVIDLFQTMSKGRPHARARSMPLGSSYLGAWLGALAVLENVQRKN